MQSFKPTDLCFDLILFVGSKKKFSMVCRALQLLHGSVPLEYSELKPRGLGICTTASFAAHTNEEIVQ